ncbi:MAG: ECF transporter S component [Sarcina sp.]
MNHNNNKRENKTRDLILTALMIALTFIAGSIIKIPTQNGMIQFGDCMIFIAAVFLDRKKTFLVAAIGMSFVDLAAGYAIWIPFTFIIKGLMGYTASIIIENYKSKFIYIIAFIAGGIVNLIGYFIANALMGGVILKVVSGFVPSVLYAAAHFVGDLIPIVASIIVAIILAPIVKKIIIK